MNTTRLKDETFWFEAAFFDFNLTDLAVDNIDDLRWHWKTKDFIIISLFTLVVIANVFLVVLLLLQSKKMCCFSPSSSNDLRSSHRQRCTSKKTVASSIGIAIRVVTPALLPNLKVASARSKHCHFLQKAFLFSLALANIFGSSGIFARVLFPRLGVPSMCNLILPEVLLKVANLQIMFSLCGCSIDLSVAVLAPLFHRTRFHFLRNVYTAVTVVMWLAVVILVGLEYFLPIRLLQQCKGPALSHRLPGEFVTIFDFNRLRDYCNNIICHHNYTMEIIRFGIWLCFAALILFCYIRIMVFLIRHRQNQQNENEEVVKPGLRRHHSKLPSITVGDHDVTNNESSKTIARLLRTSSTNTANSSNNKQSLKGVLLTACLIGTFVVIWLPHMISDVLSSYVTYKNNKDSIISNDFLYTKAFQMVMDVTEILILTYCCILPSIYCVSILSSLQSKRNTPANKEPSLCSIASSKMIKGSVSPSTQKNLLDLPLSKFGDDDNDEDMTSDMLLKDLQK